MKSCLNLFYCFALLLLSVVCSPAPTVNFSSPPFSATDFNVDQPHNFIGLRGSSNTVPVGIYPIKITFLTGSNYFSIDATGIPNNFVLTASNNIATWQTNSGSGGGGGSNLLYNFNTNDFMASLVTNIFLSLNVPRTNRNNTFYGTQAFVDILANTLNTSAGAMVGTDLSWGGMGSGDGSGIVNLNATFLTSGTVGTARLGTGAANSGTFLRGDQTWQAVPSAGITALTGDVTASGSGSVVATLANIPTSTPMAGSLFDMAIVAPATPASGKGQIYEDSTSKNLAIKNDAGVINHGVQTRTATANQWIRSIADDGSSTISQPAFTDISGTASAAQIPVATTSANGGVKVDGTSIIISGGTISAVGGSGLPTINGNGTNETFWGLTQLTNSNSGNGVSFDGTSLLLDGVNLNTGPGGTIGGIGSGLVALNGSGISSGTVGIAFLPSTVLTNLVPTNALVPSVSGHTGFIPTNSASGGPTVPLVAGITGGYVRQVQSGFGTAGYPFVLCDLNNDGWIDLIQTEASGNSRLLYLTNNHAGRFVNLTSVSGLSGDNYSISQADLNGDGLPDIVVSTVGGIQVMTNAPNIALTTAGFYYTGVSVQGSVALGDFNGDGKTDFATQPFTGNPNVSIFTNNGAATFALASSNSVQIYALGASRSGILSGDFNNDTLADLLVLTPTTGHSAIELFTNTGTLAQFALSSSNVVLGSSLVTGGTIASADFNDDGFSDFVFTVSSTMIFYTNNKAGGFGAFSTNTLPSTGSSAPVFISIYGQTYPVCYLSIGNSIECLTNSGTAYIPMYTNGTASISATYTQAGDLNNDGLPDIVQTINGGSMRAFFSLFGFNGIYQGDGGALSNLFTLAENASATTLTVGSLNQAGVATAGVLSIRTNFEPYTVAGDLIYNGNLATATNLASTNINFGLFPIQTNLISGQLYTNGYRRPVQVQANVGITTAAVTGDAGMALWIISGVGRGTTNYESISTTVAVSLAMSYTNQLGGFIPTNAIYAFTNISSGAGNSATLIGGQIY